MSVDGIINVHKPRGMTSFEIVSLLRQLSGERRVGHAGTLDPFATGVLPLFLGQGTRVIEFMSDACKTYRAEIQLGAITDTYDVTGKVLETRDASAITENQLRSALEDFRGAIQQVPPMYSAIKHRGRPLYQLARQGIEIPRRSREVHIFRLELVEWQPPAFVLEVECSSGTYIRSLAHDIGQQLGCGAFVKELTRLRCGRFDIADALPLDILEQGFCEGRWATFLHPIDEVLLDWPVIIVDQTKENPIRSGQAIALEGIEPCKDSPARWAGWCRAYSTEGHFLAALRWQEESGLWHPEKVFRPTDTPPRAACPCCPLQ